MILTDTAVTENVVLSPTEHWLAKFGIRPEDKRVTTLLFANMFMSGIAIGMIRVCALTLFLRYYSSDQLAVIAILLAFIGMPVTIIIDRFTHRLSIGVYVYTILGAIVLGLAVFRIFLGVTDSRILIFTLPLFFELVYMLFSLQFIALLTRLLNVRQAKRLSALTRSGEFFAEMVGGFLIVLLLNLIDIPDLLVLAMLATGAVFAIAQYTARHFRANLLMTNENIVDDEIADNRMLSMTRIPYVRLIAMAYATYMFAYFALEIAFYDYASLQYLDDRALASFIAEFFAVTGLLTMLAMVLLFAPFLRRFGIVGGIVAFPLAIFIGSVAVSSMEFANAELSLIFGVIVVANCIRFILQNAIWKPSVTVLFQVMPDRQRTTATSFIEGVVDPVSGGIAGLALYFVTQWLGWQPKEFLIILAALMVVWLVLAVFIRRHYLSNLVVSIQKRKLGELSLAELDNASLDIIKTGIASEYPAEIFYCLNLLEEIEHPEITELLKTVVANPNRDVRQDALRRIARMQIEPLRNHVLTRIEQEPDPLVRGQALVTYASLRSDDLFDVVRPFLDSFDLDLRRGALVAILSHEPGNDEANNYLLGMVRSEVSRDRLFAAKVVGDIGTEQFSGYLVELLDDKESDVVERAVFATGIIKDSRLINILVRMLANQRYLPFASNALRQFGEQALYDLDLGFTSPEATRQQKLQIIEIVREIGGTRAIEMLLRHIDIDVPELRHQIYLGLASLHYQADPDDQYVFVNKLDEEVQTITWLLAAMDDLYQSDKQSLTHSALGHELDMKRDNLLLLTSFLFPSIVMLDTRAHIDSKVAELRIFALEVLDNLLTGEIKQIVLPLLDDLTVRERLDLLRDKFPQEAMEPVDRFNDVVERHYDYAFFWTRSTMLYHIGLTRELTQLPKVYSALDDPEPIIRETAIWCLSRMEAPDLHNAVQPHVDDPDANVRDMAAHVIAAPSTPSS